MGVAKTCRNLLGLSLTAAALGFFILPAAAQSVDRDPVNPQPVLEAIEVAERDRVLRITQEIVTGQISVLERQISEVLQITFKDQLDRSMMDLTETTSTATQENLGAMAIMVAEVRDMIPDAVETAITARTGSSGSVTGVFPPEGTIFVACVNGKALYRDQTGTTFYTDQVEMVAGLPRCAP